MRHFRRFLYKDKCNPFLKFFFVLITWRTQKMNAFQYFWSHHRQMGIRCKINGSYHVLLIWGRDHRPDHLLRFLRGENWCRLHLELRIRFLSGHYGNLLHGQNVWSRLHWSHQWPHYFSDNVGPWTDPNWWSLRIICRPWDEWGVGIDRCGFV